MHIHDTYQDAKSSLPRSTSLSLTGIFLRAPCCCNCCRSKYFRNRKVFGDWDLRVEQVARYTFSLTTKRHRKACLVSLHLSKWLGPTQPPILSGKSSEQSLSTEREQRGESKASAPRQEWLLTVEDGNVSLLHLGASNCALAQVRSVNPGGWEVLIPSKLCRRGQSMF